LDNYFCALNFPESKIDVIQKPPNTKPSPKGKKKKHSTSLPPPPKIKIKANIILYKNKHKIMSKVIPIVFIRIEYNPRPGACITI
jgi:hypothetical protein